MPNPIDDIVRETGWFVADGSTDSDFVGRGLEAGTHPNGDVSSGLEKCSEGTAFTMLGSVVKDHP
tara:strand:- start:44 stop:238 length:195 start_codon:yes stop_codon:yes gene_type:complete